MDNPDILNVSALQDFIPLNTLSKDHLKVLVRNREVEVVCGDTVLFTREQEVKGHVYLLSGELKLRFEDGSEDYLLAGSQAALYPVAHQNSGAVEVVANTDCRILRLDSEKLDKMLCWDQAADYLMSDLLARPELDEDIDWICTLLKSNLFYDVPPMNLEQVINCFEACVVEPGDVIVRQGELGDYCYVVKEGEAAVWIAQEGSNKSERVALLGPGKAFGEDALLHEARRNATVQMLGYGVLMRLHKKDFQKLLQEPPVDRISMTEANKRIGSDCVWLDVRSQREYEHGHYSGAPNFPLNLLKMKSRLLDKDKNYIAYCDTGRRSLAAASLLQQDGYRVMMLEEGIGGLHGEQHGSLLTSGDDVPLRFSGRPV
jgi:CRP-like cAMP-binding protein